MARTDHYIGLNDWATALVSVTQTAREKGVRILPSGEEQPFEREVAIPLVRVEKAGELHGLCTWFDLNRYIMPDGTVYEEFLQAQPWSGGPYHYIALKRVRTICGRRFESTVKESLWDSEEVDS